jgi:hypothetical protein
MSLVNYSGSRGGGFAPLHVGTAIAAAAAPSKPPHNPIGVVKLESSPQATAAKAGVQAAAVLPTQEGDYENPKTGTKKREHRIGNVNPNKRSKVSPLLGAAYDSNSEEDGDDQQNTPPNKKDVATGRESALSRLSAYEDDSDGETELKHYADQATRHVGDTAGGVSPFAQAQATLAAAVSIAKAAGKPVEPPSAGSPKKLVDSAVGAAVAIAMAASATAAAAAAAFATSPSNSPQNGSPKSVPFPPYVSGNSVGPVAPTVKPSPTKPIRPNPESVDGVRNVHFQSFRAGRAAPCVKALYRPPLGDKPSAAAPTGASASKFATAPIGAAAAKPAAAAAGSAAPKKFNFFGGDDYQARAAEDYLKALDEADSRATSPVHLFNSTKQVVVNGKPYQVKYGTEGTFHVVFEVIGDPKKIIKGINNTVPSPTLDEQIGYRQKILKNGYESYKALKKEGIPVPALYNEETLLKDGVYLLEKMTKSPNQKEWAQCNGMVNLSFESFRQLAAAKKYLKMMRDQKRLIIPDFKPDNVAFDDKGQLVVIDFCEDRNMRCLQKPVLDLVKEYAWDWAGKNRAVYDYLMGD